MPSVVTWTVVSTRRATSSDSAIHSAESAAQAAAATCAISPVKWLMRNSAINASSTTVGPTSNVAASAPRGRNCCASSGIGGGGGFTIPVVGRVIGPVGRVCRIAYSSPGRVVARPSGCRYYSTETCYTERQRPQSFRRVGGATHALIQRDSEDFAASLSLSAGGSRDGSEREQSHRL